MNFALKTWKFVLKTRNCVFLKPVKNMEIFIKNKELCIKNKEFLIKIMMLRRATRRTRPAQSGARVRICIKNDEFSNNDGFSIKNDEFCRAGRAA